MQWTDVKGRNFDCLENGDVVSFLFKDKGMPEIYEYDSGLFLQPQKLFSWGRTLEYLKKQGATHFMIYEFPEGE